MLAFCILVGSCCCELAIKKNKKFHLLIGLSSLMPCSPKRAVNLLSASAELLKGKHCCTNNSPDGAAEHPGVQGDGSAECEGEPALRVTRGKHAAE